VVDGVFEQVAGNVIFHWASNIDAETVAQVKATLRRRILRGFVGRGLLERFEAKEDAGLCAQRVHGRCGCGQVPRQLLWATAHTAPRSRAIPVQPHPGQHPYQSLPQRPNDQRTISGQY
jgi:hypothetical protein